MSKNYLIIVRKDEKGWVIDPDPEYILNNEGGYPVLELQVRTIRALAPTPANNVDRGELND